ncbi:metalloendoproteinase 3-MMP-like [Pistacia vera]|uniref:metalloendoproteinase 3-MMP-like n=1 Tax=Pistacia vera TaxID=55513 RepID=UPI001263B37B|nr:metalloendoproteinase 3-MMP-like [Pistacia vera]
MASRSSFLFGLFFLLIAMSMPTNIHSESTGSGNPFGFIQHLEGCHKGQNISDLHNIKRYLGKFGYLNYDDLNSSHKNHENDDEFDDLLESAVKKCQQNHHLNVTGTLDSNTLNQMMKPRCGVPDFVNDTNQNHHKHNHNSSFHTVGHYKFFPGPSKWTQSQLKYRFASSVPVPISLNLRSVIQQAFQRWAQVSHFTFQEVPANSNANIVDLESVAVHEIGHLLGLDHELGKPDAIMYDSFEYGKIKRELTADDIQGIRVLYGLQ